MPRSLRGLGRGRLESEANRTQRPPRHNSYSDCASDRVEAWEFIPTGTGSLVFKTWLFEATF